MSGHSKWSKIRHKKGLNDAKKGKVFSKYAQLITIAAKEGGGDPEMNPNLRLLVDKARSEGMPNENVDRAIKRGTGEGEDGPVIFEAVSYEAIGPAGVGFIIDVLTDNRNRTVADIRNIIHSHGGRMADANSVAWNFNQVGNVDVRCGKVQKAEKFGGEDKFEPIPKDEVLMKLMDIEGVQDIEEYDKDGEICLSMTTDVPMMGRVRDAVLNLGYVVLDASLVKVPKDVKTISPADAEKVASLYDELDDYDDVQNIWVDAEV